VGGRPSKQMMSTPLHRLAEAITSNGGTITSPPNPTMLRWDIPPSRAEALNALLRNAGWVPLPCGASSRLGHDGFHDALIFELHLPKTVMK
jgi:hypothetical protein